MAVCEVGGDDETFAIHSEMKFTPTRLNATGVMFRTRPFSLAKYLESSGIDEQVDGFSAWLRSGLDSQGTTTSRECRVIGGVQFNVEHH